MNNFRSIIENNFIDIAMLAGHAYIMSSNKYTLDKMNTIFLGGIFVIKGIEVGILATLLFEYDDFCEKLPRYGREFGQSLIHIAQQYEQQLNRQNIQPVPPAYEDNDESVESETSEEHENAE